MVGLFLFLTGAGSALLFGKRGSCIASLAIILAFGALLLWFVATDRLPTNW